VLSNFCSQAERDGRKKKPHIPETALESWAPKWLKKYAEENGLSLADLFNFEEGRFLRRREVGLS